LWYFNTSCELQKNLEDQRKEGKMNCDPGVSVVEINFIKICIEIALKNIFFKCGFI
jgi:hypothetical protein